jgi:uncharacterized membrane protein
MILLISSVKAFEIEEYNIEFEITEQLTVNELLKIVLREEVERASTSYLVLGDVSDLRINNTKQELEYNISKGENEYRVDLIVPRGTKELLISFVSRDLVFSKGDTYQFFTVFRPPQQIERIEIKVSLPKGYVAYRNLVFPVDADRRTDGERIYFVWSFTNESEEIPLSVRFYNPHEFDEVMIVIPLVFSSLLVILLVLYYRRKVREEFFRGFSKDERRVVEILLERKRVYQNKLEKELGFSRAKMTRIVKKLEEKGLIEKEKAGRTNKLRWK